MQNTTLNSFYFYPPPNSNVSVYLRLVLELSASIFRLLATVNKHEKGSVV